MKHFTRTLLYMLTLLLSAIAVPADAQQRQDALYIFRNDGQFNAFFYGDIDHICYSKIDTLGVEQPDYVVQEVYALDTLFRIPISAIDSVAFVTPENIVKADVFCPDKSIADYIIASDSLWWIRLAPNTPASLIPKEGDKLLIEGGSKFIPDGFGGRVALSVLEDEGWMIITEATPLVDIYDRLVIKSAASTKATPEAQARNRSRTMFDGTVYADVPEVTITLKEFDEEYVLNNSTISTPDGPIQLSVPLQGTIKAKYKEDLSVRTHLFIDPGTRFNYNQIIMLTTKEAVSADLEGGISGRIQVGPEKKIGEKKLPDGLKAKASVGIFVEGSLSGYKLGFSQEREVASACFISVNESDLKKLLTAMYSTVEMPDIIKIKHETKKDKLEKTSLLPFQDGVFQMPEKMSITIGAGASLTLSLVSPIEKAKEMLPEFVVNYLKKYHKYNEDKNAKTDTLGFDVALGIELGGKLEASAPWKNIWHDTSLLESQPIYKDLSKGNISGSVYFKAEAKAQLGSWSLGKPPYEPSETLLDFGIVPLIPSISVKTAEKEDYWAELELGLEIDERPYNKLFYAPVSGNLITSAQIGFAIYDEDKQLVQKSCHLPWLNNNVSNRSFFKNGTYREILAVDPGKGEKVTYTAYPVVVPFSDWGGVEMLADAEIEFEVDSASIEIEKREITVDRDQHFSIEDRVVPNMANLQVKSEADWIEDILWLDFRNELSFTVKEMPKTESYRRGVIRLTGLSQTGIELIIDSIVVKQGEMELAAVTLTGDILCSSPTYEEGEEYHLSPMVFAMNSILPGWIKTTKKGKDLHVECSRVESDDNDRPFLTPGVTVSFDILNFDAIDKRESKIANLKIDNQMGFEWADRKSTEIYKLNVSSQIPQIDERTLPTDDEDDDDDGVSLSDGADISAVKAWAMSAGEGLSFSLFDFKRKDEDYNLFTGELEDEQTHKFSLINSPSNNLQIYIAFK